ncbi:MAG: cupredoxin domain-containing protein [Myxococcota bacterium]
MAFPHSLVAFALMSLFTAGCNRSTSGENTSQAASASRPAEPPPTPDANGRLPIRVTQDGFVPARARVKVGQPVTLVVTRTLEKTCATEIVISEYGINKPLPLNQAVEVTLTPKKPGNIHFACGMDMITGELIAE